MAHIGFVVVVVSCGLAGAASGWLGRRLLIRARRGVRPPPWRCEIATGVLWAIVAIQLASAVPRPSWALVPMALVPMVLGWLAVPLIACDLLARRLPDALTLPAYPIAGVVLSIAALARESPASLVSAALGGGIYGGLYGVTRLIAPGALGPGDVKLAGSLGAFAGSVSVSAVALCMLAAAVLTALVAWRTREGVPHGPAMLLPVWLVTLVG